MGCNHESVIHLLWLSTKMISLHSVWSNTHSSRWFIFYCQFFTASMQLVMAALKLFSKLHIPHSPTSWTTHLAVDDEHAQTNTSYLILSTICTYATTILQISSCKIISVKQLLLANLFTSNISKNKHLNFKHIE